MQQILDWILEAIEDEKAAQKHYDMLSKKVEDPMAKKFFEQLKMDEIEHERVLRSRYEAFAKMMEKE
jgi:rubrerythrin